MDADESSEPLIAILRRLDPDGFYAIANGELIIDCRVNYEAFKNAESEIIDEGDRVPADAEIGVSMAVCSTGSQIARQCVNDPEFMAADNWSAELAARMFKAMVAQAVEEGRIMILPEPERSRTPLSEMVPKGVTDDNAA